MAAKSPNAFDRTERELRGMLAEYEGRGVSRRPDAPGSYILTAPPTEASNGKEVWFAGVRRGKSYVSFHLMPVYAFPELLKEVSPRLKKRMQGKSCFNFTDVDPALLEELGTLTAAAFRKYRAEKLIR